MSSVKNRKVRLGVFALCFSASFALIMAGCASSKKYVWLKPGAVKEELLKDERYCRVLADDYRTYFNGLGANVEERAKQLFEECMEAKSYELAEQKP